MLTLDKETLNKIKDALKESSEINFDDFVIVKKTEFQNNPFWKETLEAMKEIEEGKGIRIKSVKDYIKSLD